MNPNEMISDVRFQANSPGTFGRVTDSEVISYANRGKDMMAQKVIESDVKFFETDEYISFVAGQEEYDIPRILLNGKPTNVERLNSDGTVLRQLSYVPFQEKLRFTGTIQTTLMDAGQAYYLRGRKIGFPPTPQQAMTNAVKLYGIQFPHDMIWFKALSVSASTFVIPPSTDATNMKAGRTSQEIDYYKNARFRSISGSSIGTERICTAYDPITRIVTVSAAMAPIATNDELVLLCEIPDEYHQGLVKYAVGQIAAKDRDRTLYQASMAEFRDQVLSMMTNIDPRAYSESLHIMPPTDLGIDGL